MNKIINNIFIAGFIFLFTSVSQSQETQSIEKSNFGITISPQHAILSNFRIGLDKQIGSSSSWLIFTPSFTSSYNDNIWGFSYDRRIGGGLNVSHRIYMNDPFSGNGVYFQYGLVYNYNQLHYQGTGWVNSVYEGIEVLTEQKIPVKDEIHQYGFDLMIGIQAINTDRLIWDFYLGIGSRNRRIIQTEGSSQYIQTYDAGILAPTYQGVLPLAGMRIGIMF